MAVDLLPTELQGVTAETNVTTTSGFKNPLTQLGHPNTEKLSQICQGLDITVSKAGISLEDPNKFLNMIKRGMPFKPSTPSRN